MKQLSENTRDRIRMQEVSRRVNQRKALVLTIITQNQCTIQQAIDIYKNRCTAKLGYVPDEVIADLQSAREELAQSGTATA